MRSLTRSATAIRAGIILMRSQRSLRRRGGFTVGAVALLGTSLALLAIVVALFDAVATRPLPFPAADRLVAVYATVQRGERERRAFSRLDFADYQAAVRSLDGLAAYSGLAMTLTGAGAPRVTAGEAIDAQYFDVFDVAPAFGRAIDASSINEPVAVVSSALWRERLGGNRDALGRTLMLDGLPYTVIGVMPEGFRGLSGEADVWLPMNAPGLIPETFHSERGARWHEAIGRLADGSDLADLNAELDDIGLRLVDDYPDNAGYAATGRSLRDEVLGAQADAVGWVGIGVLMLFVVAVMNLAGVALVRATARRFENAMRGCLGATRSDFALDAIGEGLWVGMAAALTGLSMATLLLPLLPAMVPLPLPPYVAIGMSPTTALTVFVGGVFGGIAAFALGAVLAGRSSQGLLASGARTRSTQRHRVRGALLVGQVATGVALLGAAMLLGRSVLNVVAMEPGYRVDGTAVVEFELVSARYTPEQALNLADRLRDRVAALPGVENAALASDTPLSGSTSATLVVSEQLEAHPTRVYRHAVSDGFFAASGLPMLAGRDFRSEYGAGAEAELIVSERMARRVWGDDDAVGRRLQFGRGSSEGKWWRVVGVAADSLWRGIPENPTSDPDLWVPLAQAPSRNLALVLHAPRDPAGAARRAAAELAALDGDAPVFTLQTMVERVSAQSELPRFVAVLGMGAALSAWLLAALGLYTIATMDAAERNREMAVRRAVGADAAALAAQFAREYGRLFAAGIATGLLGAIAIGAQLKSQLVAVSVSDPIALGGATVLFAVALTAALARPLHRVISANPATLLRQG